LTATKRDLEDDLADLSISLRKYGLTLADLVEDSMQVAELAAIVRRRERELLLRRLPFQAPPD
jgi:hypothetical protein